MSTTDPKLYSLVMKANMLAICLFSTFLMTRPSLMLNGLGLAFAVIRSYFAFTDFLL